MEIGPHSYVGDFGRVDAKVTVGKYTSIAPFVDMLSRIQHGCIVDPLLVSTSCGQIPHYPAATVRNTITIGNDVLIGQRAVLLGGITIGDGAIIGACSVVARDVKPYEVVIGNPVQTLRYRFVPQTIAALLTIQWWDWPHEVVRERVEELRDVNTFVARYGYDVFEKEQ